MDVQGRYLWVNDYIMTNRSLFCVLTSIPSFRLIFVQTNWLPPTCGFSDTFNMAKVKYILFCFKTALSVSLTFFVLINKTQNPSRFHKGGYELPLTSLQHSPL